ncbi:unnamed protein product [Somion occarium]|uniref:BHLH domain-containing protein n=1 Tax=Somion occarium TaxID=3059160 RepID=A0ABP1CI69_9APHY
MDCYTVSSERYSYVADTPSYQYQYAPSQPFPDASGSANYYSASEHYCQPTYYQSFPSYPNPYGTYPSQPVEYAGYIPPSSYYDPNYPIQYPQPELQSQIHAPVPLSAYSTLIPPPLSDSGSEAASRFSAEPATPEQRIIREPTCSPVQPTHSEERANPLDRFINAPQVTFQTPCDLLSDLAVRAQERSSMQAGPSSSLHVSSGDATPTAKPKAPKPPKCDADRKPVENQRKVYFRNTSDNVGFHLTDPDSITSHDKKRHHLESLERYILWLHDQLRIVNQEPASMERVKSSKGLSSRSIRTLLLHMQEQIRTLHGTVEEEEQNYVALQELIITHKIPVTFEGGEFRRHSIASGAIPAMGALLPPH